MGQYLSGWKTTLFLKCWIHRSLSWDVLQDTLFYPGGDVTLIDAMDFFARVSQLRRWFLTGIAALLLFIVSGCGQPAVKTSSPVDVPPVLSQEETPSAPPAATQADLGEILGGAKSSLMELNEQAATSLDEASDRTADAIQETKKRLQQSLEETAEVAGETLQELNEEAAKVIDGEMDKAASAIQSELEKATDLSVDKDLSTDTDGA